MNVLHGHTNVVKGGNHEPGISFSVFRQSDISTSTIKFSMFSHSVLSRLGMLKKKLGWVVSVNNIGISKISKKVLIIS